MAIERADADACAPRHGFKTSIRPAAAEHALCSLQHALAVALRIDARLAQMFGRGSGHRNVSHRLLNSRLLINGGILRITTSRDAWQSCRSTPGARAARVGDGAGATAYRPMAQAIPLDHSIDWNIRMNLSIGLTVNGERREIVLDDPRVTLLDLLR